MKKCVVPYQQKVNKSVRESVCTLIIIDSLTDQSLCQY